MSCAVRACEQTVLHKHGTTQTCLVSGCTQMCLVSGCPVHTNQWPKFPQDAFVDCAQVAMSVVQVGRAAPPIAGVPKVILEIGGVQRGGGCGRPNFDHGRRDPCGDIQGPAPALGPLPHPQPGMGSLFWPPFESKWPPLRRSGPDAKHGFRKWALFLSLGFFFGVKQWTLEDSKIK